MQEVTKQKFKTVTYWYFFLLPDYLVPKTLLLIEYNCLTNWYDNC